MQVRFFTIPVHTGEEEAEELNRFLAGHRIVSVDRQLVQDGANSAWTLCISFEQPGQGRPQPPRRGKVDYRDLLSEADFTVYARLRSLRKELAEADGVPLYTLFTNEQMAEMVTRRRSKHRRPGRMPGPSAMEGKLASGINVCRLAPIHSSCTVNLPSTS